MIMDILTLCYEINLQPEIKIRVLDFADSFNFDTVDKQLKDFLTYENMSEALIELQNIVKQSAFFKATRKSNIIIHKYR